METCSPTKRRALAPLDANALASPKTLFKPGAGAASSPVKMAIEGRKRLLEMEGAAGSSPAGKKPCLGRDEDASERSASPDVSSVFDTSANDASWATAATEDAMTFTTATTITIPTTTSAPPVLDATASSLEQRPARRTTFTRQQVRETPQKAEILRLRLSLANYKVRTGQTTVPLADLQRRPLPAPGSGPDSDSSAPRVVRVQSPSPRSSPPPPPPSSGRHRSSSDSQRTELMEPSEAGDVPGAD
ncbi:hypothetical protein ACJZ2D_010374 [Fusarium nematophilum]